MYRMPELSIGNSAGFNKFSLGVETSRGAEGAKRVGFGEGCPHPSPMGRGLCPPPQYFFDFRAQNGEIWCILGAVFHSSAECIYTQLQIQL